MEFQSRQDVLCLLFGVWFFLVLVAAAPAEESQNTELGAQADVRLVHYVINPVPDSGDLILSFEVVNDSGSTAATGVVVEQILPSQGTFLSTSGCSNDPNGSPSCDLGTINPGDSKSFTVTMAPIASGAAESTATVTTTSTDPDPSNNTATAQTCIYADPPGEFPLNLYTDGVQKNPAVACGSLGGSFVVAWESDGSYGDDSDDSGIQARMLDSLGAPDLSDPHSGRQFQVNTYTAGDQINPAIGLAPGTASGDFVVVWESEGSPGDDSSDESIQVRRFLASGEALGDQFQVNTYTPYRQGNPAAVSYPNGKFIVVWESLGSSHGDRSGLSIQIRAFGSDGTPQGGQYQVNSVGSGRQANPAIASPENGAHFVVWDSAGADGDGAGIRSKFYYYGGGDSGELAINTTTVGEQTNPSVAIDNDQAGGRIIVVWESEEAGSDTEVRGRLFEADLTPLGDDFLVNVSTVGNQTQPSVAVGPAGGFIVTWTSDMDSDGSVDGIFRRPYSAAGVPGDEFQVNAYTTSHQGAPSIAIGSTGNALFVWESDGSSCRDTDLGIAGRVLIPPSADLEISTSFTTVGDAVPGEIVTLDLVVTNGGPVDVIGARIDDSFHGDFDLEEISWTCSSCTPSKGDGPIENVLVDLLAGETATVSIEAPVVSSVTGVLENCATVTQPAGVHDPDPINNSDCDSTVLTPKADLAIEKTGPGTAVPGGDPISYTLTVTNHGPSDSGADLVDVLPGGLSCDPLMPSSVFLVAGTSAQVSLVNCFFAASLTGEVSNSASVNPANGVLDMNNANDQDSHEVMMTPVADMAVDGEVLSPTPAYSGSRLEYLVSAENFGPSDIEDVVLTFELPPQTTFVEALGCTEVSPGSGTVQCDPVSVSMGHTEEWDFSVTIDYDAQFKDGVGIGDKASFNIFNSVAVTSPNDPNSANDSMVVPVEILPDFQVNTTNTTGGRDFVKVAISPANGDFVIVWQDDPTSGGDGSVFSEIHGRHFDSNGVPIGEEFRVNAFTTGLQTRPEIVMQSDGGYVVVWRGNYAPEPFDQMEILARRFDSGGAALGPEILVNGFTGGDQRKPAVAVTPDDDAVIVWESPGVPGEDGFGIRGRQLNSDGTLTTEFQVNSYTTGQQYSPDISFTSEGDGRFVVVWTTEDGDLNGIAGQKFDNTGAFPLPEGDQFQVNSYTTRNQFDPTIQIGAQGRFMVVWESKGSNGNSQGDDPIDNSGSSVQARNFEDDGTALGEDFQVNEVTTGDQKKPVVEFVNENRFLVTWYEDDESEIPPVRKIARRENSLFAPTTPEFSVNGNAELEGPNLSVFNRNPDIAAYTRNRMVVVWQVEGDPNLQGNKAIVARIVAVGSVFADGFESEDASAWSETVPAQERGER